MRTGKGQTLETFTSRLFLLTHEYDVNNEHTTSTHKSFFFKKKVCTSGGRKCFFPLGGHRETISGCIKPGPNPRVAHQMMFKQSGCALPSRPTGPDSAADLPQITTNETLVSIPSNLGSRRSTSKQVRNWSHAQSLTASLYCC